MIQSEPIRAAASDFEARVFFVGARAIGGLRSGRHRSLLAKITKPNGKKRRVNRVKGFASRGLVGLA